MAIRVAQLGSPRTAGEGLQIGTVRPPSRGHGTLNAYPEVPDEC